MGILGGNTDPNSYIDFSTTGWDKPIMHLDDNPSTEELFEPKKYFHQGNSAAANVAWDSPSILGRNYSFDDQDYVIMPDTFDKMPANPANPLAFKKQTGFIFNKPAEQFPSPTGFIMFKSGEKKQNLY